jgi:subtilisin
MAFSERATRSSWLRDGRDRVVRVMLTWAMLFGMIASFSGGIPGALPESASAQSAVPSGNVIVVLRDIGIDPTSIAGAQGVSPTHVYQHALLGFSANLPQIAAERIARLPAVYGIFPDRPVYAASQLLPTGVNRVNADTNEIAQIDGIDQPINASVAILDTGVTPQADLNVQASGTDCVTPGSPTLSDLNGHGTHVAGTIAARDNDFGVVGVAPGARIHSVRVLGPTGTGSISGLICGLDWVAANASTIDVVNLSLTTTGGVVPTCASAGITDLQLAVCGVVNAGVTVVAAAGNGGGSVSGIVPASYPQVIAVSAFADFDGLPGGLRPTPNCSIGGESDDVFSNLSNFGPEIDIMAPGVCIQSLTTGGGIGFRSGTSMAAAHVSGASALYQSVNPGASPESTRAWLLGSASTTQAGAGVSGDKDAFPEPVLRLGPDSSPTPSPAATVSATASATSTTSPSATTTVTQTPQTSTPTLTVTATATRTPTVIQTATATSTPASGFAVGSSVRTVVNLNMRAQPSTSAPVIAVLPQGTVGTVTGAPQNATGFTWYPVNMGSFGSGWVAGQYLEQVTTPPTNTPAPATNTPQPTATNTPRPATNTPVATATATATASSGIQVGDSFRTLANLNLRSAPTTSGQVLAVLPQGATGTVVGGPQNANGFTWYQVSVSGYPTGWVAGAYIEKTTTGPTPTATRTPTTSPATSTPTRTPTRTPTGAAPTSTPTTSSGTFQAGDTVVVNTDLLNLRSGPSPTASVVGVMPNGTTGVVIGAPVTSGGFTWIPLNMTGYGNGWAASTFLRKTGSAPTPTATSTATVSGAIPVGATVQTTTGLNMRTGPSTTNAIVAVLPTGAQGTVIGGPQSGSGYTWYQVNMGSFGSGWVVSLYIQQVATAAGSEEELVPTESVPEEEPIGSTDAVEPVEPTATQEATATTAPVIEEPTQAPVVDDQAADEPVAQEEPAGVEVPAEGSAPEPQVDAGPQPYPIVRVQRTVDTAHGQILVDEDPSTSWYTTSAEPPRLASFALDLGEMRAVGSLRWLAAADTGLLGSLRIDVSTDGQSWQELDIESLPMATPGEWQELPIGFTTRYIRFVFLNDSGVALLGGVAEVEIWP